MLKKLMTATTAVILLTSINTNLLALSCPTMDEIKAGHLNGWQALDTNSDDPIPAEKAIQFFKKHGTIFWLAQWAGDLPLQGQCYYFIDTGYPEIYFAHPALQPKNPIWKDVGVGVLQCKADITYCTFPDKLA